MDNFPDMGLLLVGILLFILACVIYSPVAKNDEDNWRPKDE